MNIVENVLETITALLNRLSSRNSLLSLFLKLMQSLPIFILDITIGSQLAFLSSEICKRIVRFCPGFMLIGRRILL